MLYSIVIAEYQLNSIHINPPARPQTNVCTMTMQGQGSVGLGLGLYG